MGNLYEQLQEALAAHSGDYEIVDGKALAKGQSLTNRKAINWLRRKIDELYGSNPLTYPEIVKESSRVLSPADRKFVGKMYMFQYNALGKDELPYYDKYPLTYVIRIEGDGFLGCNLHYVRLTQRDELAKSLLNNSAQGAVSVPRRTLHKYLYTAVKDIIFPIPEDEWSDVAQLPTEEFINMRGIAVPRNKVYSKT